MFRKSFSFYQRIRFLSKGISDSSSDRCQKRFRFAGDLKERKEVPFTEEKLVVNYKFMIMRDVSPSTWRLSLHVLLPLNNHFAFLGELFKTHSRTSNFIFKKKEANTCTSYHVLPKLLFQEYPSEWKCLNYFSTNMFFSFFLYLLGNNK